MVGMLLGAGAGIAQNFLNQDSRNKLKRIQEGKVHQMETENDANRERLQSISPEAAHQATMADINSVQAGAESAALNTVNNSAVSGSGEVGSAGSGAVKSAMAAQGAATPMAQMKQQAHSDMVGQQTNKGQAIDNNIMQGAEIGNMVNYNEQDNHLDFMGGLMGGLNTALNATNAIKGLGAGEAKDTTDKPAPVPTNAQINMPTSIGVTPPDLGSMDFTGDLPKGLPMPPGQDVLAADANKANQDNAKMAGSVMFPKQYPPKLSMPAYNKSLSDILNPNNIFGRR